MFSSFAFKESYLSIVRGKRTESESERESLLVVSINHNDYNDHETRVANTNNKRPIKIC